MSKEITKQEQRAIQNYWLKFYVNPDVRLCSLCGNTGEIDTRGLAVSHAGIDAGRINYCICPNGVAMRVNDIPLSDHLVPTSQPSP